MSPACLGIGLESVHNPGLSLKAIPLHQQAQARRGACCRIQALIWPLSMVRYLSHKLAFSQQAWKQQRSTVAVLRSCPSNGLTKGPPVAAGGPAEPACCLGEPVTGGLKLPRLQAGPGHPRVCRQAREVPSNTPA